MGSSKSFCEVTVSVLGQTQFQASKLLKVLTLDQFISIFTVQHQLILTILIHITISQEVFGFIFHSLLYNINVC